MCIPYLYSVYFLLKFTNNLCMKWWLNKNLKFMKHSLFHECLYIMQKVTRMNLWKLRYCIHEAGKLISLPSMFLQQIYICSTILTSVRSKSQTTFSVSATATPLPCIKGLCWFSYDSYLVWMSQSKTYHL